MPDTPIPPGRPLHGVQWAISEGLTGYAPAVAAMEARAGAIRAGTAPETVWLVEHPPTYTAGTSARPEDLRDSRFPRRGGGPGRAMDLSRPGPARRLRDAGPDAAARSGGREVPARDVRCYVHALEEWMIRALWSFHLRGERRAGRVGIWVVLPGGAEAKIGAIGVRVTRWVAWHGVALNVEPDLSHFSGIVPCGVAEHGVTSLHALGVSATMEEVDSALMSAWAETFSPG